ncbi:hypothetical protein B0H34DRAFT_801100 [Crassisporium funariophilum]|nr:hypothetical protein B0H34DRAFT_801100 [Crassisporium funariophilum]
MALISRRLQRLTWGVRNPFSGFYLHSPTANFFSTLTHLSFPATVDDFEAEHLIPFSTLRFQSLYSFKIGSWDVDASEPCTALTQFLIAHPTLHELALGYASDGLFYGDLDPNVIRPDMLPNLQRLEAHARIVTMLAEKDCKCLDDISSLSTGQGLYHNALDDVEDMLMQLAMRNGLPRVNHLSFMAGDWASDREDNGDFFSWMEGFADICPNLEVWSGPLPKISLNMLTLVLGRFAKLQEIEERSWSVSELSSTTMIDVVRRIASQCPSLRHFDLKAQLKPQRYTIFRDSAGLMSSTVLSSLNDEFWLSDNWS